MNAQKGELSSPGLAQGDRVKLIIFVHLFRQLQKNVITKIDGKEGLPQRFLVALVLHAVFQDGAMKLR